MNITISEATEDEISSFEQEEWKKEDKTHYGRIVKWEEWKPDFYIFKAVKKGSVVGVVAGHHIAGVLFIERIIVAKAERNKGIGALLLDKTEQHAKKIGAHKLYLYAGKGWKSNDFYVKQGYHKTGELPKHFLEKDFVIYEKHVEEPRKPGFLKGKIWVSDDFDEESEEINKMFYGKDA